MSIILNGDATNETLTGTSCDDTINGFGGNDIIDGLGGDDVLLGGSGNDSILGGDGGDFIEPGTGNDTIVGQAGGANGRWNELAYIFTARGENASAGITVLFSSQGSGFATDYAGDSDIFSEISRVWGTDNADQFFGSDGTENFVGFAGNDTFDGGAGSEDEIRYDTEGGGNGATMGISIDLISGTGTDGFGDTDTISDVENIRGNEFNDLIIGSDVRNKLRGNDGNDTLIGNGGNDNLNGGTGDDSIVGGVGGDFLQAGQGSDTIEGNASGVLGEYDELSYYFVWDGAGQTGSITVTYTTESGGTVSNFTGGTDIFSGIDRVWGTGAADTFNGTDGTQRFVGMGGNDTFNGGNGIDRVDYSRETNDAGASSGVTVDLGAGTATDAFGDQDTLNGIEYVRGSTLNDTLLGSSGTDTLRGDAGDDLLSSFGGSNNRLRGNDGNDTINAQGDGDGAEGGDGNDLITFTGSGGWAAPGLGSDTIIGGNSGYFSIHYDHVGESLTIDTGLGQTQFTGGDVDEFSNIRNVGGGQGNDTILGDDDGNWQEFFTSQGNDFYDGKGGGRDWIIFEDDDETAITVNFATGIATGAFAGTDTFVNIEGARGTAGNDTYIGGDLGVTTLFQGMDGVDTYTGGAGEDRLDFGFDDNRGGLNGITTDLAAGTTTDGFGNSEVFTSIEQIAATDFEDVLYGDAGGNSLFARGGNDTIDGRDGDDFIMGGQGVDQITLGSGADFLAGTLSELNGDFIHDFSFEDEVYVFDSNYDLIAANLSVQGDQLLVDIDGDGSAEASMTLLNGYSGPVTSSGGDVAGTTPTVFEIESAGRVTKVVEGDSGTSNAQFTILRSGDISTTATVGVFVQAGSLSAPNGEDIDFPFLNPQEFTFLPGQTSFDVVIPVFGDTEIEQDETLHITLVTATSDGALPAEVRNETTNIVILNDDAADTVRIEGGRNAEGSGSLEFTVSRTGDTSADLVVQYDMRTAGGLNGAEVEDLIGGITQSGTVTILAGQSEVTLAFDIQDDAVAELHDNVIVAISPDPSWPANLSVDIREATGSIRNDDGVPPSIPLGASASSFGDPHIVTLDGLNYAFQAVGEFTLIEAVTGDPLLVQVRYQAVPGSDLVSRTEAVATQLNGIRVNIDITSESLIRIDGIATDISANGTDVGNGQVFFDGEVVTVVFGNGEQLRVDLADGFLNTSVFVGENRDVRGLLGNGDGQTGNDLSLRDGTVLQQPVDFDTLYGTFANDWRLTDATTLFDYAAGRSTDDFTNLSFPVGRLNLNDFPDELVLEAEAAVQAAGISDPALAAAAILDILVTGDTQSALEAAGQAPSVTESITPTDAPLVPQAVGVFADKLSITEGNSGTKSIFFTVYRTGDLSQSLSVDLELTGNYSPTDVAGPTSGTVLFSEGQTAETIEIGVVGDTVFEENETLTLSLSVADSAVRIITSTASTIILDDDEKPLALLREGGAFADDLLGALGDDTLTGGAGDDTLNGAAGNDTLNGGEGVDTAIFEGNQSSFTLSLSAAGATLTDRSADGDGTDQLQAIEFLDFGTEIPLFSGGPMNLDIFDGPTGLSEADFGAIIELYIAYYNRAPDALGLYYWATEFSNGFSLPAMAENFFAQTETQATYASVLDSEGNLDITDAGKVGDFVNEVYGNVLGRTPDVPGFDYWTDELLNNPAITPDKFILSIIGGAKNPSEPTPQTDLDQAFLATKSDLGIYFSVIKGMSDVADAASALALFDGSAASVTATVDAIDAHYADALDPATGDFLMPLIGVIDDPFGL